MTTPQSRTVQSVDRAVALLRALAEAGRELSLAELSERCGLERPTAWRLLWTLESNGLVTRPDPSRGYLVSLGRLALSRTHAVDALVRLSRPVLAELSSRHGVTASLVHVDTLELRYVDQVDSGVFASPRWEGALSLHASSPGKAVLAALPDAEWRAMVGPTLDRLTDTTVTGLRQLARELATVRDRGYAVCHGEDVTYSNGASAVIAVGGRPVGAIDLWGPDRLVPAARLDELGAAAVVAAAGVAASLA